MPQLGIIEKAQDGPVILLEHGSKPALLAIVQSNGMIEHIELLEAAIAVYKKKWELATGQDELVELHPTTIQEWLGDDND